MAFNAVLEKRGIYNKNPADYKTHFHNWSKGGKKENFQFQDIEKSPLHTGGKLSEIVKAIRNEQQQSV